jgi:hypothetical protein
MKRSLGLLLCLALSALVAGCGDSNPFIGKWQSDKDNFLCALGFSNLEITEKSFRTGFATQLYTLVKDGDAYIFDTKEPAKILARVGPGGTMTLEIGPITCSFRRAT